MVNLRAIRRNPLGLVDAAASHLIQPRHPPLSAAFNSPMHRCAHRRIHAQVERQLSHPCRSFAVASA